MAFYNLSTDQKLVLQPRYPVLVPESAVLLITKDRFYHSVARVIDIELILNGIEGTISIDERLLETPNVVWLYQVNAIASSSITRGRHKGQYRRTAGLNVGNTEHIHKLSG